MKYWENKKPFHKNRRRSRLRYASPVRASGQEQRLRMPARRNDQYSMGYHMDCTKPLMMPHALLFFDKKLLAWIVPIVR